MKSKQTTESKATVETTVTKTKLRSLRPMRSMVAIRSLKPKTLVAKMDLKTEQIIERD